MPPSPKITGKNLSYDAQLPPFLQRMQAETAGRRDLLHSRPAPRPQRPRDADALAEDEPTYVDEDSQQTLSKAEYEALLRGDAHDKDHPSAPDQESSPAPREDPQPPPKDQVAGIGATRKRKVGRVVGSIATDEHEEKREDQRRAAKSTSGGEDIPTPEPSKKKKAKKIKLSFDDA